MKTRSETRYEKSAIYIVEINFDEASELWKTNKRSIGNGCYKYLCNYNCKSGNKCKREPKQGEIYCSTHLTKSHS
jgi:hypothetical protein